MHVCKDPAGFLLSAACHKALIPVHSVGQPRGLLTSAVATMGDDSLLVAMSGLANFSASCLRIYCSYAGLFFKFKMSGSA